MSRLSLSRSNSLKTSLLSKLHRRKSQSGLGAAVIVLIVIAIVVVIAAMSLAGGYNSLVQLDAQVQNRASNIDSQMKRRADLIPNLVATVKGYAKHERGVFADIAQARSRLLSSNVQANPKEAAAANSSFNSALGRLMVLAESYPQLKADQNFTRLQDELTGTENRINFSRVEYNDSVKAYNIAVRVFPGNIIAGFTGFQPRASFEASASEKATPKVDFE